MTLMCRAARWSDCLTVSDPQAAPAGSSWARTLIIWPQMEMQIARFAADASNLLS